MHILIVVQDAVIRVSYLEIYLEQVKDLLNPSLANLDVFVDEKVQQGVLLLIGFGIVTPTPTLTLACSTTHTNTYHM